MNVIFGDVYVQRGCTRFGATYRSFYTLYFIRVGLSGAFFLQYFAGVAINFVGLLVWKSKYRTCFAHKIKETQSLIVENGNVAGGLISHMNIVSLRSKTRESSAH